MSTKGAVACGHPATARAAAAVLEEGGNAFDAALAGMCAACVAEPLLGSLGGGGFLLARPTTGAAAGRAIVYDFFAHTPQRRRPEHEVDFFPILARFGGDATQEFHIGLGSIATPGAVKGLFEAHRDLGFMPLRRLVEPAVALAREGTRVDPMLAYTIRVLAEMLGSRAPLQSVFTRPDVAAGEADPWLRAGDLLRMPELADALEILAIEGEDLFYRGEMARSIADDCAAHGGFLTVADLEGYRVERRQPIIEDVFGLRLFLNPPPSTGGILIAFALELLRDGDLPGLGRDTAAGVARLAQVMALTNRARVESRLHELEAGEVSETLLDPRLLARYRAEVLGHPSTARGTTHVSVVDGAGNAASLTFSNGEGSGYMVPGAGIILNNMLGEEDINPAGFHRWPVATRMSSMMAPTLSVAGDGSLLALGSGGSNRLRTAILQVLLNVFVHRTALEPAVEAPRIHYENERLSLEPGFDEGVVATLKRTFAEIQLWPERNLFFGGVHAVRMQANGGMEGVGDPRRGGAALLVR